MRVGRVWSFGSTLKTWGFFDSSSYAIPKYVLSITNHNKSQRRLYPQEMSVNMHLCMCMLCVLHGHYQMCVSACSSICHHVFGFHYYLTAANKQFMPLNWGNTLYPDTRLGNHLDFLSFFPLWKRKYLALVHGQHWGPLSSSLQGSFETWKVQRGLSCWPGIWYWITDQHGNEIWIVCS